MAEQIALEKLAANSNDAEQSFRESYEQAQDAKMNVFAETLANNLDGTRPPDTQSEPHIKEAKETPRFTTICISSRTDADQQIKALA